MNDIQEIEVKARVANFDLLLQRLSDLGCKISLPITQNDTVYLPNNVTFSDISFGSNALRIRIEDGKALLTLKQRQKVELSAIEAETEVKDIPNTQKIIELLGYYEAIKINKKRRITKYNDYSICLDEVEELGNFIEIKNGSKIIGYEFGFGIETCYGILNGIPNNFLTLFNSNENKKINDLFIALCVITEAAEAKEKRQPGIPDCLLDKIGRSNKVTALIAP